jgi:hypothetical protein
VDDKAKDAFRHLAELVNSLPEEERAVILEGLSNYTHDLKHTLGLVTGANALVSRISDEDGQIREMVKIIQSACSQLDDGIMLLVDQLNNRITVDS